MTLIVVVALLLILLAMGLPVAWSVGVCGIVYLYIVGGGIQLAALPTRSVGQVQSVALLAIPLFVLAGDLMNLGGVTRRIFVFARALVGHVPGGLGHAGIVGNIIFSGASGAAIADVVGVGSVSLNAMRSRSYPDDFSLGALLSSSTLGPIIPPSINMVIYGSLTGTSIGALFVGGVVPGLLCGLSIMIMAFVVAKRRSIPREERSSIRTVLGTGFFALLPLGTPAIILGGIILGIATPTESALVAVVYAALLGLFVYGELKIRDLFVTVLRASVISASLAIIIGFAAPLSQAFIVDQVPQRLAAVLMSVSSNAVVVLLLLTVGLIILGTFLEVVAAITVLAPILAPTLAAAGVDPVQAGVIVVFGLGIGLITPPVGLCLFAGCQISGRNLEYVAKAVLPWMIPIVVTLVLLILFPALILWLPSQLGL